MKTKRKWYELFLLCLAVLVVIAIGTVQTAEADGYVEYTEVHGDAYETEDEEDSTHGEEANAVWTANENTGYCTCSASTDTWSEGSFALADAYSYGWYMISWTWDGPPGEAPGGYLYWDLTGAGRSSVYGANAIEDPNTQYAITSGSAESGGWLSLTINSFSGSVKVRGTATNNEKCENDWDISPYPDTTSWWTVLPFPPEPQIYYGSHDIDVAWVINLGSCGEIYPWTTYFYVAGGARCDNTSVTYATGTGAASFTSTDVDANVSVDGSFDPWD